MLNKSFSWSSFTKANLQENSNWDVNPHTEGLKANSIRLKEQHHLLLPLHYFSKLGVHGFTGDVPVQLNHTQTTIEFEQAIRLLMPHADNSAIIINHLANKTLFDLSETQSFIDWTLPKSSHILSLTTAV